MSAADGYVAGTTKVVDHGADSVRWNLVIMGDGYQASELSTYRSDVENFLETLRTTPPFNELFCGINVYRIDVVSTDSGADDPTDCGGTGATPATYFDATFCSTGPGGVKLERLLTTNTTTAMSVAAARVPLYHQALCIVNSSKYGGAGGTIATFSTHVQSAEIGIHEMSHSAFGLADEYGGNGTGTPAGEPLEPNVTRDTNRATNKWGALIAASTPMPSSCDASCTASTCVPPASPPAAGAVGTYEGAIYSDCNTYRPLPSCYMRDYAPFCPVCADVIRQTLLPFQPAESISLITPSIEFKAVPAGMGGVGVTTHRAIVWEVVTCRELTFEITAGPTGGFGTPLGTSDTVTADPILPAASARIWLSYTSTNPGDSAAGNVTVRCVETGQSWMINIVANTIARPRTAVSLVLDRSGSMDDDAGNGISKVTKLREAAETFINLMLPNDGIGIVTFNATAVRLMEIEEAGVAPGGAGRTTAIAHISGSALNPTGGTSIGDGVIKGKEMLDDGQALATTPYDFLAKVILTDGMWNQPPSLASVMGSINANTYAVGFGLPSNISVPALTTLCQGNNGYLLITGILTPEQTMRLNKYFLQILAGVTNAQIAADPRGVLDISSEHRIPFWICEADYGMDVIMLCQHPQVVDFSLEAPDGSIITPASGANSQFVPGRYAAYFRCALPVLPSNAAGSHAGRWHAVLKLGKRSAAFGNYDRQIENYASYYEPKGASLPYELVVHTYSSLTFKAVVAQNGFEIGSAARITTVIREYEAPATGNSKVWAEIEHPDGTNSVESLPATNSGQYGTAIGLQQPGIYRIRVRAHGETQRGLPFEREQTLTAIAAPGGRDPWESENSRTSELCELLHCLEKGKGIREDLIKRLEEIGIDFHALLKCLREKCRSTSEILETRKSRSEISAPGVGPGYTTNEVLEVLTQMLSKTRGGC